MAVTEHDDVARRERAAHARGASLGEPGVVHHSDAHAVELDDEPLGQAAAERDVVVAEHRVHRRVRAELVEERAFDDVAAVQHDVGVTQRGVDRVGQATAAVARRWVSERTIARTPTVNQVGRPRDGVHRLVTNWPQRVGLERRYWRHGGPAHAPDDDL